MGTTKRERQAHARAIRKAAAHWNEQGRTGYRNLPANDRESMKRGHRADARDLRRVAQLLLAGELREAWALTLNLDTLVRELIPYITYEYMARANGEVA